MLDDTPLRRADDQRFEKLDQKLDKIADRVNEMRDWMISDPEKSYLGKALSRRADVNAQNIEKLDDRLKTVESWMTQWKGSWRLVTGVAVVLGIIATFFSVVKPLVP